MVIEQVGSHPFVGYRVTEEGKAFREKWKAEMDIGLEAANDAVPAYWQSSGGQSYSMDEIELAVKSANPDLSDAVLYNIVWLCYAEAFIAYQEGTTAADEVAEMFAESDRMKEAVARQRKEIGADLGVDLE